MPAPFGQVAAIEWLVVGSDIVADTAADTAAVVATESAAVQVWKRYLAGSRR